MGRRPASISRVGLDPSFEIEETNKSNLLLQASLLREQGQEEAASLFAKAAAIEEHLADSAARKNLMEKSFVHRFSAASSWAQAGNFYQAIVICDMLLATPGIPERLKRRVQDYADTLRSRRADWQTQLIAERASTEG